MTDDKVFLDTNILIYAFDISAGGKHHIANELLMGLWERGSGVVSIQVLQEFFVNVTQKIRGPLDTDSAKEIISDLLKWDVIVNDGESILHGIEIQGAYRYSFWDSMIIAAAIRGSCDTLLSEDLSEGQMIEGVSIKNPFRIP
jgi:predicted nucleic acid-binding protein